MLRNAIISIAIIVILGGIAWSVKTGGKSTYEAIEKVTTVEVEVDTLDKRITTAQEAEKANIEAKAKEAYDKAKNAALLEIELAETAKFRKELEERESQLEQQVSF